MLNESRNSVHQSEEQRGPEKKVYGVYQLANGKQIICANPITEQELLAYKHYRDSFFGVPLRQGRETKDPLDLFDFFYESYQNTPRDRLLEFVRTRPDFEELKSLSDEELLISCCEGWVYAAMSRTTPSAVSAEAVQMR